MSRQGEPREKLRKINEAELYAYKKAFDKILEYLHYKIDLYSASVDESDVSVRNTSMEWFSRYIQDKIDEHNFLSTWRKNKGHIF